MPSDITFTVKESVANGRRLIRADDDTIHWEPVEPLPAALAESSPADPAPTPSKSVVKRVKTQVKRLIHG